MPETTETNPLDTVDSIRERVENTRDAPFAKHPGNVYRDCAILLDELDRLLASSPPVGGERPTLCKCGHGPDDHSSWLDTYTGRLRRGCRECYENLDGGEDMTPTLHDFEPVGAPPVAQEDPSVCTHLRFQSQCDVQRLLDNDGIASTFTMDVRVWCSDCGTPFEFQGLPGGSIPYIATRSVDALEGRFPIRPTRAAPHSPTEGAQS